MNHFRSITAFLFINAFLAVSALAQTQPAPKIGFIDSEAFYDSKLGITKLINANKQLDTEFGARIKELQDGGTRIQTIAKELDNMQKLPQAQFNQAAYNTKQDEGERLQRELNYKKTELETAIKKRREILVGPISKDVGKALDDYAKKNGFGVILDVSKLTDAVLIYTEAADATKDFITFFNARVAPPAVPVKPK